MPPYAAPCRVASVSPRHFWRPVRPGGEVSDLAAKGIIVVDIKPSGRGGDESDKGIIIVDFKPADGAYIGPGGAGFTVKRGIIVQGPAE